MATAEFAHAPVLLEECLAWLAVQPGAIVVDGTVGGAGHADAILRRSPADTRLIGLDRDPEALDAARERLAGYGARVQLLHGSFADLPERLAELGVTAVDAVLLDLGVSSHQLDTPRRGFRFGESSAARTPLDMRMDPTSDVDAAALLARASAEQLEDWLRRYADLRGARRLARALVAARERAPLRTAADLVAVVRDARVGGGRRHDPATLVFQALRIATNDELGALERGLAAAIDLLVPGGRLVVIAYHSGEDRIVKDRFRHAETGGWTGPSHLPVPPDVTPTVRLLRRGAWRPSAAETAENPRAEAARLRAVEKLDLQEVA